MVRVLMSLAVPNTKVKSKKNAGVVAQSDGQVGQCQSQYNLRVIIQIDILYKTYVLLRFAMLTYNLYVQCKF